MDEYARSPFRLLLGSLVCSVIFIVMILYSGTSLLNEDIRGGYWLFGGLVVWAFVNPLIGLSSEEE